MQQKRWISYIQMTGAMILVGSSVVAARLLSARLPVFLSQGMSLLLALPILLRYRRHNRVKRTWSAKNVVLICLQALFGTFLFRICLLYGMRMIDSATGGIIVGSTSAMLALLSFALLQERLSLPRWLGVALSFAAVMCLQTYAAPAGDQALLGGGLLLLAVFGEAMLTIFRKRMTPGVPVLSNVTAVVGAALIMFLPVSILEAIRYDWTQFGWAEAGLVAYYGVCVTALAYLLWFGGIEDTPGHVAAVFTGVAPVSTVLLSTLIGEPIRPIHGLATLLLLGGIWVMARETNPGKKKEPEPGGQETSA